MSINLPKLASSDVCTGCAACANICPYNCINMQPTLEGFLEPEIDPSLCPLATKSKCGICEDICPVLHPKYLNKKNPDCFALQASDEEREQSSSGAFIPILAKYVLGRSEGGFVYGAAWTNNLSVEHVEVSSEEELSKIRLSKYFQSNPQLIYRQAKGRLREGKWVLFTGTPCEIAGFYSNLGKTPVEKLITVDLVCHGVSSNKVFKKFLLDNNYEPKDIKDFKFRDKAQGWGPSVRITLKDGSDYKLGKKTSYMKAFNSCLIQRKSCGVCPYAKLPRQGDFSCGDFWGVEKFHSQFDNKGTSFVLVNSQQGQKILAEVKKEFPVIQEIPIEEPIQINKTVQRPFPNHSGRQHFFSAMKLKSFNELVSDSLSHHYDIGLVGPWFGINYGSILTYYALYQTLRSIGYDIVMLPRPKELWERSGRYFDNPNSIAMKFIRKHCNVITNSTSKMMYYEFNKSCENFILGSDIVWNYAVFGRHLGHFCFFDWVSSTKKTISYASSIGSGGLMNPDMTENRKREESRYIGLLLKRFSAISVRERSAVKTISELSNRTDVVQVLDPVFMIEPKEYLCLDYKQHVGKTRHLTDNGRYVFAYILTARNLQQKKEIMGKIKQILAITNICFCPNPWGSEKVLKAFPEYEHIEIDVETWLQKISRASFFLGDSFHGLCFALIFHIPFLIVFSEKFASIERFRSLLSMVNLEERLICESSSLENTNELISKQIDWGEVDSKIASHRSFSKYWLIEQLTKGQEPPNAEVARLEFVFDYLRGQFQKNLERMDKIISEQENKISTLKNELQEVSSANKKLLKAMPPGEDARTITQLVQLVQKGKCLLPRSTRKIFSNWLKK